MATFFQLLFMQYLENKATSYGRTSRELDAALGAGTLYAILLDIAGIAFTIKLLFF